MPHPTINRIKIKINKIVKIESKNDWGVAQWVKGLLHKDKDPRLDPSVHIRAQVQGSFSAVQVLGTQG